MNKKKKIKMILFICIVILFVLIIIFYQFNYKFKKNGNNSFKDKNIKEYFLNISSYNLIEEITIKSNKNSNKYIIKEEYNSDKCVQSVLEPEEIKNTKIIKEKNNLEIRNEKFNLSKVYKDYQYICEDFISLNGYIKDFLNEENNVKEEEDNIYNIYEIELKKSNKYIKYKKIYFDKKTNLPCKIEISDINRNILVYIEYKEIEIK